MALLRRGVNSPAVAELQSLLNSTMRSTLPTNGNFDEATEAKVREFQLLAGILVDGVVGPVTLHQLRQMVGPVVPSFKNPELIGVVGSKKLTEQDIQNAAAKLKVSVAHIKTVCAVEARGSGFLTDGRPKILFERHYFYARCPKAVRGSVSADICSPTPGGYIGNAGEWSRLARARQVDDSAALESASWGLFQIMGSHWKTLGYSSVQNFVEHMTRSEGDQLDAFVRFVLADQRLLIALRTQQWAVFARIYNGKGYAKNQYDIKLAQQFAKFSKIG